jgi:hypothetical protein
MPSCRSIWSVAFCPPVARGRFRQGEGQLVFLFFLHPSILDATPAHFLRRHGVVPRKGAAQSPVQALVNEDPHDSNRLQHLDLGCFNDGDDLFAFHSRKAVKEVFDGFAAFEVVDEVLKRDASANKNWRPAHDFRIGVNDAFQIFNFHRTKDNRSLSRAPAGFPAVWKPAIQQTWKSALQGKASTKVGCAPTLHLCTADKNIL